MDRTEFTDKLQHALAGGLGSSKVAENVRYYREYIDMEIRKGRSEEEVLESLGDPRLLAKSIIEANKNAGLNEGTNRNYDEETEGDVYGERTSAADTSAVRVPGWLIFLIAIVFSVDYRRDFFRDIFPCAGYYSGVDCCAFGQSFPGQKVIYVQQAVYL